MGPRITVLSKASALNVDGESDRVRRAGVCVGPARSATSACFLRVPAPAQRGAVSDLACPRCPGGCARASRPPRGPPPTPRGWRTAPCVFLRGRTALAHSTAGPGRRSGVPRGCGGGSAPGTCRGRAALVWPLGLWSPYTWSQWSVSENLLTTSKPSADYLVFCSFFEHFLLSTENLKSSRRLAVAHAPRVAKRAV